LPYWNILITFHKILLLVHFYISISYTYPFISLPPGFFLGLFTVSWHTHKKKKKLSSSQCWLSQSCWAVASGVFLVFPASSLSNHEMETIRALIGPLLYFTHLRTIYYMSNMCGFLTFPSYLISLLCATYFSAELYTDLKYN
jgi:hypothetical protein